MKSETSKLSPEILETFYGHANNTFSWAQELLNSKIISEDERNSFLREKVEGYIEKFGPNILEKLRPEYKEFWLNNNQALSSKD